MIGAQLTPRDYFSLCSKTFESLDLESLETLARQIHTAWLEGHLRTYPGAILLLDHPHEGGGQGKAWDWREAESLIAHGYDVIVAGGLNPQNVEQALADVGDVSPWGVDVATGVETAEFRKDPGLMKAFVEAVRRHEQSEN